MTDNLRIYSIVYKPEQVSEYLRYDNSHIKTPDQKSYLFEYNPIIDIIDNHNIEEEYLGIFSHKFHVKTGIMRKKLLLYFQNSPGYDFYNFSKLTGIREFRPNFENESHPGFDDIFIPLCQDLGLSSSLSNDLIYENFFITKTEIYKDYVNNIIKPAIELLETKYKQLAWRNAVYLPNKNLFRDTGLEHYTFHTFILERLVNQFILKNEYTIKKIG